MTLRLNQAAGSPQWYGNWPRPGRPPFMASEAYRVLLTEMRRYVREEVAGRAFLISGHRGAGKTTLVQRVVDDLGDELFRDLTKTSFPSPTPQALARRPQRPLLVKLHGPSLLADELPRPGGGEKPKEAPPSATSGAEAKSDDAKSGNAPADSQAAPTTNTGTAHGALVQITIALYRALAREFAEAYAVHARAAYRAEADDQLDIAAQFQLDLDRAPEAGLLRAYWERLADDTGATGTNAISAGIVWPKDIGASVAAAGLPDQGAREIVALATAAQAFQVCSGAVTYEQRRKDRASYERTTETQAGIDAKDAVNRIVGLAIGGLLGFGAASAAGVSTAAGAGIGLLGSLAVTASVKRSARQERNEDYTFIVDRSIQTLERDLPLVIERVREAGLAPVFLIDELDKLEISDGPAESASDPSGVEGPADAQQADRSSRTRKTVTELIRRLKHLTTDFGFFCFLTGPDYFEEVQHKIETTAFPEEHTYFSDRLFVLYTADELDAFLRSVMSSNATSTADIATDETARRVLARDIIHSSRLNTIDAVRALAHGWAADGLYKIPSGTLTSQPRYRLVVGVQLAIEVVLRSTKLAARMARDPRLRQAAVDTLYMISREWERGETEIDLSTVALARHLLKRRGKDISDLADYETIVELEKTVTEANAAALTGALAHLSELLCDFQALHDAMAKEGRGADELALAQLAAGTTPIALLRKPSDGSQIHAFRYDYDGNELSLPPVAAEIAPGAVPEIVEVLISDTRELVIFGREVLVAMHQLGLTFGDLAGVGLLPPGLSQDEIRRVIARLDAVTGPQRGASADLAVLRGLSEAFAAYGPVLGWAIDLALDVAWDAGLPQRGMLPESLRAMARFLDFASLATVTDRAALDATVEGGPGTTAFPTSPPDRTSEGVRAWRTRLEQRPDRPAQQHPDLLVDAAWRRWESRIAQFIEGVTLPDTRAVYDDLVLAAADLMPSRVMRAKPEQIGPLDWSELALAGSLSRLPAATMPPWALLAGLRQQGFGRDLFARILDAFASIDDVADGLRPIPDWMVRLVRDAPTAEKGVLVIVSDDGEPLEREDPGPYLFLRESRIEEYDRGVRWLTDIGAFRMGMDER